jgi:hypothetical protein
MLPPPVLPAELAWCKLLPTVRGKVLHMRFPLEQMAIFDVFRSYRDSLRT